MRMKMKRFLGILLSLVLVLGLMPGMRLAAYAGPNTYTNLIPADSDSGSGLTDKQVTFNGYKWYIIEDKSTSAAEGTVTLLAADTSFDKSKFHDSSNAYSSSTVKGFWIT